jgi:hypothetical protein
MTRIELSCWDRWLSLKNIIELIRLKRAYGLDTTTDREYAFQLLCELRMLAEADLMPAELRAEYDAIVGVKLGPPVVTVLQ